MQHTYTHSNIALIKKKSAFQVCGENKSNLITSKHFAMKNLYVIAQIMSTATFVRIDLLNLYRPVARIEQIISLIYF